MRSFKTGLMMASLLSLICGVPPHASATGTEQVSLTDAVTIAKAHNPDLAAVAQELGIAEGQVSKARYLSQSNFESDNEAWYRVRTNRSNSQDWRVAMKQEFEVFGQRALRIKSASINYDETAANLRDQTRLLVAAVKMTFYDAIRSSRRVSLAREMAVCCSDGTTLLCGGLCYSLSSGSCPSNLPQQSLCGPECK